MTTTVRVLIEGNKACKVSVEDETPHMVAYAVTYAGRQGSEALVQPGTFATCFIHDKQAIVIEESGDFVP